MTTTKKGRGDEREREMNNEYEKKGLRKLVSGQ